MKNILMIPNLRKQCVVDVLQEAVLFLHTHQYTVFLPEDTSIPPIHHVLYRNLESDLSDIDAMLVFGGDGTILQIAGLASQYDIPILGINLGHIGFMTELERNELHLLSHLIENKFSIDKRMMLELCVIRDEKPVYKSIALNEIVISKTHPFHIMRMDVYADGELVTDFKGDGIILATPTGSTAYAHSAGGPIIEPTAENIAVTPICPFTIGAKPLIFSPHRKLLVHAHGMDSGVACVSADGADGFILQPNDAIWVQRSCQVTRLIRIKNINFYQVLRYKLSDRRKIE